MTNELRASPRTRSLKGARIVYENGTVTRDCMVRNISSSGAKVVVETTMGIPDEFLLLFEDGATHSCTARWRKMTEIGIQFTGSVV